MIPEQVCRNQSWEESVVLWKCVILSHMHSLFRLNDLLITLYVWKDLSCERMNASYRQTSRLSRFSLSSRTWEMKGNSFSTFTNMKNMASRFSRWFQFPLIRHIWTVSTTAVPSGVFPHFRCLTTSHTGGTNTSSYRAHSYIIPTAQTHARFSFSPVD